jgi:hypothetical protein
VDRYRCHRVSVAHDTRVVAELWVFGDDGFDVELWPLGDGIDDLTALILHQGFTVNWDFDVD